MNKRNPVLAAGIAMLFASIFLGACGNPSEADKMSAAGESAAGIFESIEQEDTGDKAGDARGDFSESSSEKTETDAGSESGEPSETSKAGETAETAEKKADAGDSDLTIPADKAVYENTTMPAYVEGLWVAGVGENRDFPVKQTNDEESLKKECDQILEDAEAMGINVIFFHVRPSSDAFYKSELYPWSRYLTGTQGLAPENDFDPLDYMVKGAHERGIQLHAWINPYRIRTDDAASTPEGEPIPIEDLVTGNHALTRLSTCILPCDDGFYYLDPAEPAVRETVVNGALEIVKGYDVDGIHMDDYFYPSAGIDDSA
ncbi:MAG: family 10 glycosylhydrolase, partial [Lachnospiraceae bacterium]|nr:family 10 glycosylhydrolase [Lachnospiraceae bacterium]